MPNHATLLHPIQCPACGALKGQEIEFLDGYFPATSHVDVRLGESIEMPRDAKLQSAFRKGFRSHGIFLCDRCQATVACLVAVRQQRAVEVEVFPKSIQKLLSTFPTCLLLLTSDDGDMILLSKYLESHGTQAVARAMKQAAKVYFTRAYWTKRAKVQDPLLSHPEIEQFVRLLRSEDPEESPSPVSPWARTLDRIAGLFDDPKFQRTLRSDEKTYKTEQRRRHKALSRFLP